MVAPPQKLTHTTRVRISKSGQITLPVKIREQLGVTLGEQVDIILDKDGVIQIKPVRMLTAKEIAGQFGRPVTPSELQEALLEARQGGTVRAQYKGGLGSHDPD